MPSGFLRRIGGVTAVSLRAALRTRTVGATLALLLLCVLALPQVIKGDGTPEGYLRILLSYTLGLGFGLLAVSTLWAACSLFAAEIDSRRAELSVVKPTRALEFWAGKWLALLILNAVLLAAVYAGVYAQIRWRMHREGWGQVERPTCRFVTRPTLPSPADEARDVYAQMAAAHALPTNMTEKAILETLAAKAEEHYSIINPGEQVTWSFALDRAVLPGDPITVRIRFDTEFSTRSHVQGTCRLSCAELPEKAIEVPLSDFTQNEIEFVLDTSAFLAQKSELTQPLRNFTLAFSHEGNQKKTSCLMLRFRKDVAILTPGGPFEMNLARSAFAQWCVLGFLAAFGLTLSALLSLPVAIFTATVSLILCLISTSVVATASAEDEKSWLNAPGIWISRAMVDATGHTVQSNPLPSLTHGERLSGEWLAETVCWNVIALPTIFALIGCALLKRRELP